MVAKSGVQCSSLVVKSSLVDGFISNFSFCLQASASLRQQEGDAATRDALPFSDEENLPPLQDTPPPSSSDGCLTVVRGGQWADFAHRQRGSPSPSSSSNSSATTADTFLLEDVGDLFSLAAFASF